MTKSSSHSWRHLLEVVAVLVERSHKARYKSTTMGVVWAIVSPTLFLLTFVFLFRRVFDLQISNYASYAFIGIVAWSWLQSSVNEAVNCITSNGSLLVQPRFPAAALPVVAVSANLLNYLLTFPLMIVILSFEGAKFGLALLAVPLLIVCQFLFLLSAAYFVAALNVTLRDMQYIVPILLQLGYFGTPIFYDHKVLPPDVQSILEMNPMLHIIQAYRTVLIDGAWPDWSVLAVIFAMSFVLLGLTFRYFRHSSFRFLEEI